MSLQNKTYQVLSFDIGIKNFCFCIEKYQLPTESVTKSAMEFGETVKIQNTDLSNSGRKSLTKDIFNNINTLLENIGNDLKRTDIVLIEKQASKSPTMIRIAQFVWTWFYIKHPNLEVVNYSSGLKTSVFGQEHKTYYKRKKWAVTFTKEIMEKRGDLITLEKLKCKKSDDMAKICLNYSITTLTNSSL